MQMPTLRLFATARWWTDRPLVASYAMFFVSIPASAIFLWYGEWFRARIGADGTQLALMAFSLIHFPLFIAGSWATMRRRRLGARSPHARCYRCGYQLGPGGEARPCPECGAEGGEMREQVWLWLAGELKGPMPKTAVNRKP